MTDRLIKNLNYIGVFFFSFPAPGDDKINRSAMAKYFGVTMPTIRNWLNGGKISKPNLTLIVEKISALIDYDLILEELMERDIKRFHNVSKRQLHSENLFKNDHFLSNKIEYFLLIYPALKQPIVDFLNAFHRKSLRDLKDEFNKLIDHISNEGNEN